MARVSAHPLGATTDADEVRLALHVAAAQLRDPQVRAAIEEELRARTRVPSDDPPPPDPSADDRAFAGTLLAAIAHSGGWNAEARRRVGALTHASRRDPSELVRALRASRHEPAPMKAEAAAPSRKQPRIARAPKRRPPRLWVALAMVSMLSATFLMLRAVALLQPATATRTAFAPTPPARSLAPEPAPPRTTLPLSVAEPVELEPVPDLSPELALDPDVPATSAPPITRAPAPQAPRPPAPVQQWEVTARTLLRQPVRDSPRLLMIQAVTLARLNAAAEALWRADLALGSRLISDAQTLRGLPAESSGESPVPDAPMIESLTSPGRDGDGQLALELAAAKRQPGPGIATLVKRRYNDRELGPVDCDAVAETAFYAASLELRLFCKRIASEDQLGNAAMVNAMLEALPKAAPLQHISEMIESTTMFDLPSIHDERWPAAARAALVARLAELLGRSTSAEFDDLALALARAYELVPSAPAAADPAPKPPPASMPSPRLTPGEDLQPLPRSEFAPPDVGTGEDPAFRAAVAKWSVWRELALGSRQPGTSAAVQGLQAKRDLRLSLARGRMQRFVAMQTSLAELMERVIADQRPSSRERLRAPLEHAAKSAGRATGVFEQIVIWERAIAELWTIRLGASSESEGRTQ